MEIVIRKPRRKDFKHISKIYLEEFSKPPYNEKWTEKTAYEKIKELSKEMDVFVVFADSKVVGFAFCNSRRWFPGREVFIEEFAIQSDFQRKKIGERLLKEIENYYEEHGAEKIILISNRNSNSYSFYRKLNYKPEKENVLLFKNLKDKGWKQEKLK